jgi:hypothetical protein
VYLLLLLSVLWDSKAGIGDRGHWWPFGRVEMENLSQRQDLRRHKGSKSKPRPLWREYLRQSQTEQRV